MPVFSRSLLVAALAALALALPRPRPDAPAPPADAAPPGRTVFLARGLADEALLPLSVAAAAHGDLLLLDADAAAPHLRAFLAAYRPDRVVPVGDFQGRDPATRFGVPTAGPVHCGRGLPLTVGFWRRLFPRPAAVVVCPPTPRADLLQSACLAGALRCPLLVVGPDDAARLAVLLDGLGTGRLYLVGAARGLPGLGARRRVDLADAAAVAAAHEAALARRGPVETLLVANAADAGPDGKGGMARLAPYVAVQKRAALLLTRPDGGDAAAAIEEAVRRPALRAADHLLFVADLTAVPWEQRPNPVAGTKDPCIELEPATPHGAAPFSFATGRLFHEGGWGVPLTLARQRLLARSGGPPRAVVASNAGGELPLLETFSRTTARELANAGYRTTSLFGKAVGQQALRDLLPEADVFLYEGHHNTVICDYGLPYWSEPLRPSLVFFQTCLALKNPKTAPLLDRGAVAVVGSSTRTYSGSGGAFALAYFDALLYEGQSLGSALRHAKNFLLAYALLKEKRLGPAAKSGANLRSAWAFTLWGDPTLTLPRPEPPAGALPAVRVRVRDDRVVVRVPQEKHPPVQSGKYQAEVPANARLAGLLRKGDGEAPLVPFVFAEVRLTPPAPELVPTLTGALAESRRVFLWDARRGVGYLLAEAPRSKELHFRVEWSAKAGWAEDAGGN
jgi:hypothetical protein